MSISDPKTPDEKKQHDDLIEAAIKDSARKRLREKRGRENDKLNSDEAIRRRSDFDPHNPSGE